MLVTPSKPTRLRVYPASIKHTRVCVYACVCIQVEEAKTSKRGKSKVDGWKRVWDFYGLPTFSTFSTSPSLPLSLFQRSIERGLRMPRATGGGKTPSFARSLATPLAPRAPASLFRFLFSSSSADPPTIRLQPPCSKRSFDFYERINAPGHALFLCVS